VRNELAWIAMTRAPVPKPSAKHKLTLVFTLYSARRHSPAVRERSGIDRVHGFGIGG
jgi:membrane protein required for beta-lactamase induction